MFRVEGIIFETKSALDAFLKKYSGNQIGAGSSMEGF